MPSSALINSHQVNMGGVPPPGPSDEEIIQQNVAYVLANRNRIYDHQKGRLDAVGVIEVTISERLETIHDHRAVYGRQPSPWSRDVVARLRHEVKLMEEALRRLRVLGVTSDSPLALQLRRERENPLPTVRALVAPTVKRYRSGKFRKQAAVLLDPEKLLPGVDSGKIRTELMKIAVMTKLSAEPLNLSLTAGWGRAGQNGVTMPGKGRLETRGYTAEEAGQASSLSAHSVSKDRLEACPTLLLGSATHDVFLNESACWRNVPEKVWDYTIGGYQVMKKWLSYREHALLGRPLTPDEAREVTHMARRLAALILLQPELDRNYQAVKAATTGL
jgi:hypothetical protein